MCEMHRKRTAFLKHSMRDYHPGSFRDAVRAQLQHQPMIFGKLSLAKVPETTSLARRAGLALLHKARSVDLPGNLVNRETSFPKAPGVPEPVKPIRTIMLTMACTSNRPAMENCKAGPQLGQGMQGVGFLPHETLTSSTSTASAVDPPPSRHGIPCKLNSSAGGSLCGSSRLPTRPSERYLRSAIMERYGSSYEVAAFEDPLLVWTSPPRRSHP